MSKVIILGDLHLGGSQNLGKPGIGSLLNSRTSDQVNILEWVLSQAIDKDVSDIIITGDIFEEPKPHPTIIALLVSWLKKCTDNDVDVHIIIGNHDILRTGQFSISALDIISSADMDGVKIYKNISTFHTNGAAFTLMPFRDRRSFNVESNAEALKILKSKLPYELAGIDKSYKKIVVGHFAIEGSIPVGNEIDDATNELFCPVSMFEGYDYVWMGHIHKPQVMSKKPYVAHIGSMDLSDFGESEQVKHIVVFDSTKDKPFEHIEIPSRSLKNITVVVPEKTKDPTQFVMDHIKTKFDKFDKSIIKVNIALSDGDGLPIDRVILEKFLVNEGVFHISRISEERKIAAIKRNTATESINSTVNETTAIKMFADANIDNEIKEEFIALANSIVRDCSSETKA